MMSCWTNSSEDAIRQFVYNFERLRLTIRDNTLDLVEAIRLAETEDRFAMKDSIFSHRKNRFERKHLASILLDSPRESMRYCATILMVPFSRMGDHYF